MPNNDVKELLKNLLHDLDAEDKNPGDNVIDFSDPNVVQSLNHRLAQYQDDFQKATREHNEINEKMMTSLRGNGIGMSHAFDNNAYDLYSEQETQTLEKLTRASQSEQLAVALENIAHTGSKITVSDAQIDDAFDNAPHKAKLGDKVKKAIGL